MDESIKEVKQVRLEDEKEYEDSLTISERDYRFKIYDNYFKNTSYHKAMNSLLKNMDQIPKPPKHAVDLMKSMQEISKVSNSLSGKFQTNENITEKVNKKIGFDDKNEIL